MKKFFREFKEFISRGNVIDLAVGVIIGGAFSAIVTSLTDNIIKPLINCIGGAEVQGKIHLLGDNYIDYGAFISAVINFLIMAFIIFSPSTSLSTAAVVRRGLLYCSSSMPSKTLLSCHAPSSMRYCAPSIGVTVKVYFPLFFLLAA